MRLELGWVGWAFLWHIGLYIPPSFCSDFFCTTSQHQFSLNTYRRGVELYFSFRMYPPCTLSDLVRICTVAPSNKNQHLDYLSDLFRENHFKILFLKKKRRTQPTWTIGLAFAVALEGWVGCGFEGKHVQKLGTWRSIKATFWTPCLESEA